MRPDSAELHRTCKELEDVCAEKLIVQELHTLLGMPSSMLCRAMVLPTPTPPTTSVWQWLRTNAPATYVLRTVSTVGTSRR